MKRAMRTVGVLSIPVLLLLLSAGCASTQSVDDLSKQLADVNTRLTKLEQAEAQRSQNTAEQQANKDYNKTLLDKAIADATKRRQDCKAAAEADFNDWVRLNGTPVPGKAEAYSAPPEGIKLAHARQDKAEADCQSDYENALQAAQLKYPH
ncbi:MAG: hypothetical protein WAL85_15445 [Candidatus Korobacteraceae bacterium]